MGKYVFYNGKHHDIEEVAAVFFSSEKDVIEEYKQYVKDDIMLYNFAPHENIIGEFETLQEEEDDYQDSRNVEFDFHGKFWEIMSLLHHDSVNSCLDLCFQMKI